MIRGTYLILISSLLVSAHGLLHADLLSTDSYVIGSAPTQGQYEETGLNNQPTNLVNFGFANGGYNQGTGTAQFQATTISLNATNGNSGGKVIYNAAPLDGFYRSVARAVVPLPSAGTYYMSYTVNRGDIPAAGGDGFCLAGFGNFIAPENGPTSGFLAGIWVGFAQNPANTGSFGDLVIRTRTTTGQTAEDIVLVDGAVNSTANLTYTVIVRVDIVSGAADPISWWLNPSDFKNGDAGLTASSAASGTSNSYSFGSPADLQRLNYAARDWNGNVFMDEPRLTNCVSGLVIESDFLLGDINLDGVVDLLDVQPFVALIASGEFQIEGDINGDGVVDLLDVQGFIELLTG